VVKQGVVDRERESRLPLLWTAVRSSGVGADPSHRESLTVGEKATAKRPTQSPCRCRRRQVGEARVEVVE
jgi:hypothetical protein